MQRLNSRIFLVLLVLSLLYGCAATRPEHLPKALNGKAVVVLTTVGDTLKLKHVGTTAFQITESSVNTAGWGLGAHVEDYVVQALKGDGRFRPRVATNPESRGILKGVGYDAGNIAASAIKEKVKRVAALEEADLVLLLTPRRMGDAFFGTNQRVKGYGVYQRAFLGVETKHVVYATLQAMLYDGRTGGEITWASDYEGKVREGEMWPTKVEGRLSDQQLKETMGEIFGAYDKLVNHDLHKMRLTRP